MGETTNLNWLVGFSSINRNSLGGKVVDTITLLPMASNHLLRMVMEPKYYAFRRWLDTTIIIWEYDDWFLGIFSLSPVAEAEKKKQTARSFMDGVWHLETIILSAVLASKANCRSRTSGWETQTPLQFGGGVVVVVVVSPNISGKRNPTPKIAENKVQETLHFRYLKFLVIVGWVWV